MKVKSNRGVYWGMQNMAWNDFPLLSHPSLLPLVLQSDMQASQRAYFLRLLHSISFLHHFIYTYFVSFGLKEWFFAFSI